MQNNKKTPRLSVLALAVAGALATQNAQALSFEPADEVTVDWDTTLSYTAAWRTSGQNDDLLFDNSNGDSGVNGDDGNRNFKDGAMINNRFSILTEMDFRYRNVGFFARGSAFYDGAYFGENDNESQATVNSLSVPAGRFTDGTKDTNGKNARVLDAFAYGNFEIGERNLSVRVGQQVVQWGEGLFIPGVSSGQAPADGTKANIAGIEVKDIYLPVGQIYAEFDLTDNLSIGAYSQWEWKKTEVDASGAYFNTADLLDEGGERILLPPGFDSLVSGVANGSYQQLLANFNGSGLEGFIPEPNTILTRGKDIEASDSGQWGVSFNYFAENIGEGVDFGLYYINYHEKEPQNIVQYGVYSPFTLLENDPSNGAINGALQATNGAFMPSVNSFLPQSQQLPGLPANYRLEYYENIKLTGLSFSTNIGETNIGGEILQKKGATVLDTNGAAMRGDILQYQLSMVHSLGVTPIADNIIFAGEIGYNEVTDHDDEELKFEKSGSGMAGKVTFTYNNIFTATNLDVPVSFKKNFEGHSAAGYFIPELGDKLSVGAEFTYKDNLKAGITYNGYFGSAEDNKLTDRDFVSLNLKYSF